MARSDKPLEPGMPSGLSSMITEAFGVPEKPTASRTEVAARVEEELRRRGIRYEQLDVSDAPVRRNALFDAAGRRVHFPEDDLYDRCFVALIDLDANARWAHPAYWAFIPEGGTGPVELRDTHWPEHPRGPVLIAATCYAGIFLPLAGERRAVLTACGPEQVYRIAPDQLHPPRSPFLYELLSRWAGVSLGNYDTLEPRSLADAFDAIGEPDCRTCQRRGTSGWPGNG